MNYDEKDVVLKTKDLVKNFSDVTACDRISLKLHQNEILGIVGPNGAGKTTLISMISQELAPTSGKIEILGMDASKYWNALKPLMGVMPQEYGLYGHLTVQQHISLFARLSGLKRSMAKEKTIEIMRFLRLNEHINTRVEQLSAGWKQRVLLAMSLVHKPKIALLDEPTSKFDPLVKRQTWNFIESLKKMGMSIILTSHDMQEVEVLSDRIIFLDHGRIIAQGTPSELKNKIGTKFSVLLRYRSGYSVPERLISFLSSNKRVHQMQTSSHEIRFLTNTSLPPRLYNEIWTTGGKEIEEFTISIASVEEVFLSLVAKG